jgi:D-beta-D-heptose 7-phosphate kinase/D-beta-D-heptose 1-phosphate adenosyltransferase
MKILSLKQLLKEVDSLKKEGKKIVFTNGGFDLIHAGHINSLKEAKEAGDILIVAINSDKSIKKLKGEKRPIMNQRGRAILLSAIRYVDFVIIFDEPDVKNLLKKIKPAYHAKGGDYSIESVPERDFSKSLGIKTIITGGEKIKSSSQIIKKIREIYGKDNNC